MPAPAWDALFQLGMPSAIAVVLLWVFIQDRKDNGRTLKAISITMITFQQLILVVTLSRKNASGDDCDECKRLQQSVDEVRRLIDTQRVELTEVMKSS